MFQVVFRILLLVFLLVNCSGSFTSVGEERELIFLLSFYTCNYVVSVRMSFLLVLGIGYDILL